MERMKEFKGLTIPPKGLICYRGESCLIANSCNAIPCRNCLFCGINSEIYIEWIKYHDLTKIETPFGLLPKWVQKNLKKAGKCRKNILVLDNSNYFIPCPYPKWLPTSIYRLDPNWKTEETVKVTKEEVFRILREKHNGNNVEIVE